MIATVVSFLVWDGEQVVGEKTMTVTVTDIDFNKGFGWGAYYQLTFSDGNWIKCSSLSTVESSLKVDHTYTLSLIKKKNSNWLIVNATEIQNP